MTSNNLSEEKIVKDGESVLREIARPVLVEEIFSLKIQKLIKEMNAVLDPIPDGVALAAPQVGVSLRIFVVSRKVFNPKAKVGTSNLIFINPKILRLSAKKVALEEGCLSVRPVYGKVRRAETITVEAYNERGHKFVKTGKGLLAQILQHEIDHLDGKLFTDKAKNLYRSQSNNQI